MTSCAHAEGAISSQRRSEGKSKKKKEKKRKEKKEKREKKKRRKKRRSGNCAVSRTLGCCVSAASPAGAGRCFRLGSAGGVGDYYVSTDGISTRLHLARSQPAAQVLSSPLLSSPLHSTPLHSTPLHSSPLLSASRSPAPCGPQTQEHMYCVFPIRSVKRSFVFFFFLCLLSFLFSFFLFFPSRSPMYPPLLPPVVVVRPDISASPLCSPAVAAGKREGRAGGNIELASKDLPWRRSDGWMDG